MTSFHLSEFADKIYVKLCDGWVRLYIMFKDVPILGAFLYLFVFLSGFEDTNASFCLFLRYLYTDLYPPLSYDRTERIFARAFLPLRFKVFRWIISTFGSKVIPPMLRPIYLSYYGRAKYSSQFLLECLNEKHVQQILILGAGYDTSAYRMKEQRRNAGAGELGNLVRVFEVDRVEVQSVKLAAMKKHLAPAEFQNMTEGVVFVECDFEHDTLSETLLKNGVNPALSTAILWEGVTYYLTRPALENTIEELHKLFRKSSCYGASTLNQTDFQLSNDSTTLSESSTVVSQPDDPSITPAENVKHYLFMDYMDTSVLTNKSNDSFGTTKELAISLQSPFQTGLASDTLIEELCRMGLSVIKMRSAQELTFEIKNGLKELHEMPELVRSPTCDDECLNIVECELL